MEIQKGGTSVPRNRPGEKVPHPTPDPRAEDHTLSLQDQKDCDKAMKCLLVSLVLWLGTASIHGTEPELSELQRRGLQVALEEFHKHPPVQWAFQDIGVDSAEEVVSSLTVLRRRAAAWRPASSQTAFLGEVPSQSPASAVTVLN